MGSVAGLGRRRGAIGGPLSVPGAKCGALEARPHGVMGHSQPGNVARLANPKPSHGAVGAPICRRFRCGDAIPGCECGGARTSGGSTAGISRASRTASAVYCLSFCRSGAVLCRDIWRNLVVRIRGTRGLLPLVRKALGRADRRRCIEPGSGAASRSVAEVCAARDPLRPERVVAVRFHHQSDGSGGCRWRMHTT